MGWRSEWREQRRREEEERTPPAWRRAKIESWGREGENLVCGPDGIPLPSRRFVVVCPACGPVTRARWQPDGPALCACGEAVTEEDLP